MSQGKGFCQHSRTCSPKDGESKSSRGGTASRKMLRWVEGMGSSWHREREVCSS